jgi:hypothetical protein
MRVRFTLPPGDHVAYACISFFLEKMTNVEVGLSRRCYKLRLPGRFGYILQDFGACYNTGRGKLRWFMPLREAYSI